MYREWLRKLRVKDGEGKKISRHGYGVFDMRQEKEDTDAVRGKV